MARRSRGYRPTLAAALAALGLTACTPSLNWRQVSLAPSSAIALLPCKPDRTTRSVPLGGVPTELTVAGCDTGGATFALMAATLPAGRAADEVLAGWQQATLAHMKASGTPPRVPFSPPGAAPRAGTAAVRHVDGPGARHAAALAGRRGRAGRLARCGLKTGASARYTCAGS